DFAGGRGASEERSISGVDARLVGGGNSADRNRRGDHCVVWECRRRGHDGGGRGASAVCGGDRPLHAGGVWENSSEVEDAVGVNSGAGGYFVRDLAADPIERDGE